MSLEFFVSVEFRAEDGFAVCDRDSVRILLPRIQSGRKDDEAELEYPVMIGEFRSSVSLLGRVRPPIGGASALTEVRLDPAPALRQILQIREKSGSTATPSEYVDAFARGLLAVHENGMNLWEDTDFQVTVAAKTLVDAGLGVPAGAITDDTGRVLVASLFVHAKRGVVSP